MAASVNTSGAQAVTINVETTLATITAAGTYQLVLDLSVLANGATPDLLEVRIYGKCRTTDTERLEEMYVFVGAQSKPLWRSPPVWSPHSYRVSIEQTQGTARTYPWAIYQP